MEAGQRSGLRIFDPQRKSLAAMYHVHVERSDGQVWVVLIVVRISVQRLCLHRLAIDQKSGWKTARRRIQSNGLAVQMKHAHVLWPTGRQMNLAVLCGSKRVVAWFQPFKSGQRQPPVRFLQFGRMRCSPVGDFLLPAAILRQWGSYFWLSASDRRRGDGKF